MHADEESGVAIYFYNAFDSALVEIHVLRSGQRHKAVRQECDWVDARLEFPLVPAIVVFRGSELERIKRLGAGKVFVA